MKTSAKKAQHSFFYRNGLTIVFLLLFLFTLLAQAFAAAINLRYGHEPVPLSPELGSNGRVVRIPLGERAGSFELTISELFGKKGERLVLVTDRRDADPAPLLAHAQAIGAPEIAVPRKIIRVPEVPVLGTGKTDYVAVERMAKAENKSRAA